jgi:hypothetical protein
MVEAATQRKELKNTGYEIFVGILSVLSIVTVSAGLSAVECANGWRARSWTVVN